MTLPKLIGTFFGVGLIKPGPGTWGSLAALPFAWLILHSLGQTGMALATAAVTLIGWLATSAYMKGMNAKADPQEVVIDEVAGQWLALSALGGASLTGFVAGFVLFRAFDIFKPGPVGWADRKLPGAAGVMTDDLIAGALAALIILLLRYFLPEGII